MLTAPMGLHVYASTQKKVLPASVCCSFSSSQPGARTSGYNKTGPGKKKKLQHTERARCRKIPRKGVDQMLPGKYLNFFVFVFAFVFQAYKCNRRGALGFGS